MLQFVQIADVRIGDDGYLHDAWRRAAGKARVVHAVFLGRPCSRHRGSTATVGTPVSAVQSRRSGLKQGRIASELLERTAHQRAAFGRHQLVGTVEVGEKAPPRSISVTSRHAALAATADRTLT